MTIDKKMFAEFLAVHPFQPATALWRAVEVSVVAEHSLPSGRGLDLGCGDGKLTSILLARTGPRELVGVDLDPLETTQAKQLFFYTNVHTCPGAEIPEPSASFDFVFSNSVLEHISPIEPVLAEVARLLKQGGKFIFTVPSTGFHQCLRGPRSAARRKEYLEETDARCAHKYYWSESEWAAALSAVGLEISATKAYLHIGEVRRWESLARSTSGLLFKLYGQKRHPIEIQRRLKLRGNTIGLPKFVARVVANLLSLGVKDSLLPQGCLYIEATKSHSAHAKGT